MPNSSSSDGRMAGLQHVNVTWSASVVINSVTSQSATEESVICRDFCGNNARIIGSHSGIIGQFCENRGIELLSIICPTLLRQLWIGSFEIAVQS